MADCIKHYIQLLNKGHNSSIIKFKKLQGLDNEPVMNIKLK